MAFQQGLSGLNVFSKALDVVGHNIANASTVGFKISEAHFADVYAGALNGASATQVGIGARLVAVQQVFNQGNITQTGNGLDMAINGNGFFRVQESMDDATAYYTRNGQFHLDKDGYIRNSNGYLLTGYASPDGVNINTAAIVPLSVGNSAIPPEQTGWTSLTNSGMGGVIMGLNLDNRDTKALSVLNPANTDDWTVLQPFAWDYSFNVNMFNYSSSVTIYDQSGMAHTMTNYYVREADSGTDAQTWRVYTVIDNQYIASDGSGDGTSTNDNPVYYKLVFNINGTFNHVEDASGNTLTGSRYPLDLSKTMMKDGSTTPYAPATQVNMMDPNATPPDYNWFVPTAAPVVTSGGTTPNGAFYVDLGQTTQFGMPFDVNSNRQDGYIAGRLTNITISDTGHIVGSYSNGQTKAMGQVLLAEFINPHGLQHAGDNLWIETFESGQPTVGVPGGGTRGKIIATSVEDSNTDLTKELVNMIIFQRNYQANAQTIRTQDQILQTVVNLK
jgi:flagellar hook protein FlgE